MIKTKDKYEIISQISSLYPVNLLCEIAQAKGLTVRLRLIKIQKSRKRYYLFILNRKSLWV